MFGTAESKIIVRRTLSLTASLPRFARVGDTFEAGVLVTVQGACPTAACPPIVVNADLVDGSFLDFTPSSEATKQVEIADGETVEVTFSFDAKALGT